MKFASQSLFSSLAFAAVLACAHAGDLAIIVNKASPVDTLTAGELTKFFKAEKSKFANGTKAVLSMQESGRPEREAALKQIYKMSESEYNDYFVEATFTGAVSAAPKAYPSGLAVKKFVANTPGGIGYIDSAEVDDSVKAIKVDGKAPGEADYKLKLK